MDTGQDTRWRCRKPTDFEDQRTNCDLNGFLKDEDGLLPMSGDALGLCVRKGHREKAWAQC